MLFDPSHAPRQMKALLQNVSTNVSAQLRLLRRSLKQMRSKQYQIVYIDGLFETDLEFEVSVHIILLGYKARSLVPENSIL